MITAQAQRLGAALPPLLLQARHLARTLALGAHGRRMAGQGEAFWQYRAAMPGDAMRSIDWRRSARGDTPYIREQEWQVAQTLALWVDAGPSMAFSSLRALPYKAERGAVLALALGILALRGGERVTLAPHRPQTNGAALAVQMQAQLDAKITPDMPKNGSKKLLISDFLGDITKIEAAMHRSAQGVLLQILDPAEATFPYKGRTLFQAEADGGAAFETGDAGALRGQYLARLAVRQDHLRRLCRTSGWSFASYQTDHSPQVALLWLYNALREGG